MKKNLLRIASILVSLTLITGMVGCSKSTSADSDVNNSSSADFDEASSNSANFDEISPSADNSNETSADFDENDVATSGSLTSSASSDVATSGTSTSSASSDVAASGSSMAGAGFGAIAGGGASSSGDASMSLAAMYSGASDIDINIDHLAFPATSNEFSLELATQALALCSGGSKAGQAELMTSAGMEILLQSKYEKSPYDTSDTCAFTVAKGQISLNDKSRDLLVVAVRGTSGGEWISNFDFAASKDDTIRFSDNFMTAAQVILLELLPIITNHPDAIMLITGHSRGAAVANLLAMTLDDLKGSDNIYCYTFATPATLHGAAEPGKYTNIYNVINPCDVVPWLPLPGWGFTRPGTDITLPAEPEAAARMSAAMTTLFESSPTIKQYYNEYHSLYGAGLASDNQSGDLYPQGLTTYNVMMAVASILTGINTGYNLMDMYKAMDEIPNSENSDLAPVFEIVQRLFGKDGSFGASIFMQHMPGTYQALMGAYEEYMKAMSSMPALPDGFDMSSLPEGFDASN